MKEELFADGLIAVDVSDILDFRLSQDVSVGRRGDSQDPKFALYINTKVLNFIKLINLMYK